MLIHIHKQMRVVALCLVLLALSGCGDPNFRASAIRFGFAIDTYEPVDNIVAKAEVANANNATAITAAAAALNANNKGGEVNSNKQ